MGTHTQRRRMNTLTYILAVACALHKSVIYSLTDLLLYINLPLTRHFLVHLMLADDTHSESICPLTTLEKEKL